MQETCDHLTGKSSAHAHTHTHMHRDARRRERMANRLVKSLLTLEWSSKSSSEECVTRVPQGSEIKRLHTPKSVEALKKTLLECVEVDLNAIEPSLLKAPIHSLLTGNRSERNGFLEKLLTYGKVDLDLKDLDGMTPLHLAIKNNDIPSVKMLTAFGANVNAMNREDLTPLAMSKLKATRYYLKKMDSWTGVSFEESNDLGLTMNPGRTPHKLEVISEDVSTNGDSPLATNKEPQDNFVKTIEDLSLSEGSNGELVESARGLSISREEVESELTQLLSSVGGCFTDDKPNCNNHNHLPREEIAYNENSQARRLYQELDSMLKKQAEDYNSMSTPDEIVALHKQRKELNKFKRTGSRILCLDGGGMKGLNELDVLSTIERETGKRITELFDWIVGTSTGGIIALGLVYANKTIDELRQMTFQLKDNVFANPKFGLTYNAEALEKTLKEVVGTKMRMSDIKHPKVMVTAVYKGSTPLQLHLFNNCFEDEYSNELVWKVARYSCAGPIIFPEFESYVDGGILCNNPTEQGVTAIQNYHWERGEKLPISLVVSVGTGVYPQEKLGNVDATDISLKSVGSLKSRVGNLMDLFRNALVESETVAESCDRNFKEQGIPYYRFSPQLTETISAGETDIKKLVDMVITTRQQTVAGIRKMVCNSF